MLAKKTLTPAERKRLDKTIAIILRITNKKIISEVDLLIIRQRMKHAFFILGVERPNRILVRKGLDILEDFWPFKIYRLRKLINGWRA